MKIHRYNHEVYSITLKRKNKTECLPVHIHGFVQKDGYALSPQVVACQPIPEDQPGWAVNRPSVMRNFLLWCKRESIDSLKMKRLTIRRIRGLTICLPVWGFFYVIKEQLDRSLWRKHWPLYLIYQIYTWKIPVEHFQNLKKITLNGVQIPIPNFTEKYLALRYGDWRTPNREWCYWRDDGALMQSIPELISDFKKR